MEESRTEDFDVCDQDLLTMARDGDRSAAEELWARHSEYGRAVARGLATPREDPEALSTKAWALILHPSTIEQGLDGFRPYLYLVIRAVSSFDEDAPDTFLTTAYASLPDQWCEVLWYAHVESMKPTEISILIGVGAAEVPRLLHQARDGLRQEWAHLHAEATPPDSTCRQVWESSYVRNLTRDQNAAWIDNHMRTCRTCRTAHSDSLTVASHLREQLLPTITGLEAAASLTAYIKAHGPCALATTDLPERVSDLFIPRTTAPVQESSKPAGAPGVIRRPGLKPITWILAVLVVILVVVIVIVSTRGNPSSNPSDSASITASSTSATQIVTVDTGAMNNLYPIVSGTTVPNATVNIQIGTTDVRVTADDTGAWTTAGSDVDFSSINGMISVGTDQEQDQATATFEIQPPPDVTASGTQITVTGLPGATVDVLVGGDPVTTISLDSSGNGTADLTLDAGATYFVQVQYTEDSRYGARSTPVSVFA